MLAKVKAFLNESRQEFKRVNWPTFSETTRLTLIVIIFSLLIALFLGVLDTFLTYLLGIIIS